MWLIVIGLLIWAAFAGVLWTVVKIAAGVALGIFFGGLLIAAAGYYLVRRALNQRFGSRRTPLSPRSEGDPRPY